MVSAPRAASAEGWPVSWTSLERVVRGKLLQVREEDFTMAAKLAGAGDAAIIVRHRLPSFISYPWLLLPALFVAVLVLAFNFVGDGLRDTADPDA